MRELKILPKRETEREFKCFKERVQNMRDINDSLFPLSLQKSFLKKTFPPQNSRNPKKCRKL
jgi:hypothetical protein